MNSCSSWLIFRISGSVKLHIGDLWGRKMTRDANFPLFSFLNFPLVQFFPSPILGSISTFKTFMCGDHSALKKPEMQILHWFSFLKFLFFRLSPSVFLGSISMFKTFMRGHLCMVTFLHLETRDANFPLVQFSLSPILGSVSTFKTFMCGYLYVVTFVHLESRDANFPLIQFSKLSIGSVFQITHPRFHFNI